MSEWPLVALGDIFTIARGGSPRPIDSFITDDPNGVNWIMIGDTVEGSKYITETKKRIRKEGVSRSREVKPGDFLLTNSMSFGHPYILATAGCIHDGWLVLSPRDNNVDQDYFYHLLGSPFIYAEFERLAAGAVVKNLNSDLVRGVKVPHPPLAEQRRIADILDKADAIRRKRKETIALTEDLLRSAFLEMFGDPVTNPRGWPVRPLGTLGELDRGRSRHRPRNDPRLLGGKHPLIQTGEVASSDGVISSYKQTYSDLGLAQSKMWTAGTLCITIAANIAKTGVLAFDACFPDSVVGFTPGDNTTTEYVQYWLGFLQPVLERQAPQVAQKNINLEILRTLDAPVPPIGLQRGFAALVKQIRRARTDMRAASHFGDALFDSLVARSFSSSGASEAQC